MLWATTDLEWPDPNLEVLCETRESFYMHELMIQNSLAEKKINFKKQECHGLGKKKIACETIVWP